MGGGEILKKGWLIKSPPLEGGGIKSWRKRFFYLRSSKVLEYHKSEKEAGELKGVINLEDCKAVNANLSHKKYKFVFDIETKDRTYFLVATSQEEMTDWVDTICKVCNFSSFALVPGEPPRSATANSSKNPSHQVSAPLPPAGVPLSERFKPTENGLGGSSIYSLAAAEQQSVQRQLSKDPEIPAGVSLSEALATKGMGSGGGRPVSVSSRTSLDGDAAVNRLSGMSDSHYFVPRSLESGAYFDAGMDSHSLYASPTNNAPLSSVSPGFFESKPRAATMLPPQTDPLPPDPRHRGLTTAISYGGRSALVSGSGATLLENGYMKPRPCPDRVPDYDYLPRGPPRPADPLPGNVSPPRQHRSALLNRSGSGSPSSPPDDDDPHTYMNVSAFHEGGPPPIDRSNKPPPPQPPRIDRKLKPGRKSDAEPESDLPLPPSMDSPGLPRRMNSISGSPVEDQDFFTDSDMPRRTSKSTTYIQVQFDPMTRRPIPLPRSGGPGKLSPRPRVEYADVDLMATRQLSEENEKLRVEEQKRLFARQKVTLRTAEQGHLAEKDYVNVGRDGEVDDDTNPDYYTFMRGFTYEDADKPPYFIQQLNIEERPDSEGEMDEAPKET